MWAWLCSPSDDLPFVIVPRICKAKSDKDWGKIREILENTLKLPHKKLRRVMKDRESDNFCGYNLLTLALIHNAPFEVIQLILEIDPTSRTRINRDHGELPIHIACYKGTSIEIVNMLIQDGNGDTLLSVDNKNRTPLHYAVLYALIYRHMKDRQGRTHCIGITGSEAVLLVKYLSSIAPAAVLKKDSKGLTPLQQASHMKRRFQNDPSLYENDYEEGVPSPLEIARSICTTLRRSKTLVQAKLDDINRMQQAQSSNVTESITTLQLTPLPPNHLNNRQLNNNNDSVLPARKERFSMLRDITRRIFRLGTNTNT